MALRAAASDSPTASNFRLTAFAGAAVRPATRFGPVFAHCRIDGTVDGIMLEPSGCRIVELGCAVDHGHQSPLMAKENQRSVRVGTIEDHRAGMDQHHHDCWCEISDRRR
jgi:hypothetical protein